MRFEALPPKLFFCIQIMFTKCDNFVYATLYECVRMCVCVEDEGVYELVNVGIDVGRR